MKEATEKNSLLVDKAKVIDPKRKFSRNAFVLLFSIFPPLNLFYRLYAFQK